MKLESLKPKELKIIADKQMRTYLLKNTPSKNGLYFCPLKNNWYSSDNMHVAHFIDRAKMSTRYDLMNCHLISKSSNTFDSQVLVDGFKSKHHKEYEEWLVLKYGYSEIEKLKLKSESLEVFTKDDYINVINNLTNG